jgi:hypothetical protein
MFKCRVVESISNTNLSSINLFVIWKNEDAVWSTALLEKNCFFTYIAIREAQRGTVFADVR